MFDHEELDADRLAICVGAWVSSIPVLDEEQPHEHEYEPENAPRR